MRAPGSIVDASLVLVSWNTRELLRACLDSIFRRRPLVSTEVICVDNASSDGSAAMVRSEFPEVTVIENPVNLRFVEANNQAMEVARGRYVLLLNTDTIVLDGAIDRLVAFADRHPRGAVFGGRVLNPNGSVQRSCFMYPSTLNSLLSATYLYKVFPRSPFFGREFMTWWGYDDAREVETVSGCFALVRRKAIDAVGMMDPIFSFYGDDIDWCFRFRAAGWKVLFTPDGCVVHYGGRSTRVRKRAFLLQLHGSVLIFARLHRRRVAFPAMRLLTSLFFAMRLPYWAVKALLTERDRTESRATAVTYAMGATFALFSWKRLLMNRAEVLRLLESHDRPQRRVYGSQSLVGL